MKVFNLLLILILLFIPVAYAIDDFPYNNIDGKDIRYMKGMTYVNATDICLTDGTKCLSTSGGTGFSTAVEPLNSTGSSVGLQSCSDTQILAFNSTYGNWQCQAPTATGLGNTTTEMRDAINASLYYQLIVNWSNILNLPTLLSYFTDDLGDRGYNDLTNFTNTPGYITNDTANFSSYTYADWQLLNRSSYNDLANFTNSPGYVTNSTAGFTVDTNETTRVNNLASSSCTGTDKVSSFDASLNPTCTADIDTYNTTLQMQTAAILLNGSWNAIQLNGESASFYYAASNPSGYTDDTVANAKHTPGDCPSGEFVQNTTTSGVECAPVAGAGTVTSVGSGDGLTGGPIISSGTLSLDTSYTSARYVNRSDWTSIDNYPTGCSAGNYVRSIGDTLVCELDDEGVTSVATGNGLTGGTITTNGTLSVSAETCSATDATNWNGTDFICITPSGGSFTYSDYFNNPDLNTTGSPEFTDLIIDSASDLLYVNSTSNKILIGTQTDPFTYSKFVMVSDSGANSDFGSALYNNAGYPTYVLGRARGTIASPTIIQSGDNLGGLLWNGYDGTDLATTAATITAKVKGTPSENNIDADLIFTVTGDIKMDADLIPITDDTVSIGNTTHRFSASYFESLYQGSGIQVGALGDCGAGEVIQNVTEIGVECITQNTGTVTSVTGTSPIVSSEGTTPAISLTLLKDIVTTAPLTGGENNVLPGADADLTIAMPVSTAIADGYLSSTDWSTFNGKSDTDTTYTASGTLLDLTGTTFSVNEGTLTDERVCEYEATGTQLECNTIKDLSGTCSVGSICTGANTYPASQITTGTFGTGNYVMTSSLTVQTVILETDTTNHKIYDNSTCVIITGDTSTLSIC